MADRHQLKSFLALAERARHDAGFRARLVADPHAAAAEAGVALAPWVRVRFVEKPAELDQLVYLPDPAAVPLELTEEELEAVAGGTCGLSCNPKSNDTNCTSGSTSGTTATMYDEGTI